MTEREREFVLLSDGPLQCKILATPLACYVHSQIKTSLSDVAKSNSLMCNLLHADLKYTVI